MAPRSSSRARGVGPRQEDPRRAPSPSGPQARLCLSVGPRGPHSLPRGAWPLSSFSGYGVFSQSKECGPALPRPEQSPSRVGNFAKLDLKKKFPASQSFPPEESGRGEALGQRASPPKWRAAGTGRVRLGGPVGRVEGEPVIVSTQRPGSLCHRNLPSVWFKNKTRGAGGRRHERSEENSLLSELLRPTGREGRRPLRRGRVVISVDCLPHGQSVAPGSGAGPGGGCCARAGAPPRRVFFFFFPEPRILSDPSRERSQRGRLKPETLSGAPFAPGGAVPGSLGGR